LHSIVIPRGYWQKSVFLIAFGVIKLYDRQKKNMRFALFIGICVFAIFFGGINAIMLDKSMDDENLALNVQAVSDTGLSPDADVEWEYDYIKCKHMEYISTKASNDMIGKSGTEIANLYGAKLVSYQSNNIKLKKEINSYCPRHYILKKDGDNISIYKPISGSEQLEFTKTTDIKFSILSGNAKTEIENGKAFEWVEDLELFLEDIDS